MSLADKAVNARPYSESKIAGCKLAQEGITFRQLASLYAMQGIISVDLDIRYTPTQIAKFSVEQADALIAQLEKDGE